MKKLVAVIGFAALGAMACKTEEEEASLKVSWSFAPDDGCLADEEIHFSLTPDVFGEDDIFNCENPELDPPRQEGTMGAIPLGSYTIEGSVWLGGAPEQGIPPETFSKTFNVDGQLLEQSVVFSRAFASYNISLSVDFGAVGGSNCDSTGSGGTGVSQMSLDLIDNSDSSCIAVTVADTDTAFDHEDSCSTTNSVCMETDTVLTLQNVPPGDYSLEINGYPSALDPDTNQPVNCWTGALAVDTATFTSADTDIGTVNVVFDVNNKNAACQTLKRAPISGPVATR